MNVKRSWFFFLVMLIICVCATLLLAEKPITESWNTLHGIPEWDGWQAVGTGTGKTSAAAGWRDGALCLRYFTTDGVSLSEKTVPVPDALQGGTISAVFPVREGFTYVSVYSANAETLYLLRTRENGESDILLDIDCTGYSFAERVSRTKLSELVYEDGFLVFAVQTDGELNCYRCGEDGGLEAIGSGAYKEEKVFSVLTSLQGVVLLGGPEFLSRDGTEAGSVVSGQIPTHLTVGRGGWYYIDAAGFDLCFVDAAFGASYRLFHLDTDWKGSARSLSSVALTPEESVLMLLDSSILTVTDADGMRELSGILGSTRIQAVKTIVLYSAAALLAAVLLWLLLFGLRRGYASLAVFRGSLFIAAAMLCFTLLHFGWISPMIRSSSLGENKAMVSGVLRAARAEDRMQDEELALDVCSMLEGSDWGQNVCVVLAEETEGEWKGDDGRRAVLLDGFSPELAERAKVDGTACELNKGVFRFSLTVGERSLGVRIDDPVVTDNRVLSYPLLVCFGILACVALLVLLSIGVDLRRISKRMEHISRGNVPQKLNLRTGDELESMASIVNSLAVSMTKQDTERKDMEYAYRRFVPEKVLALLGKRSIQDVDKSSFAARRMAVMTVWFSFPDSLYTDVGSSRLLFDSVNEVIERTASIVARKGGTVFHFAYNGFDVVMESGGEAVSTAVAIQQEVLSFNEMRAQNSIPGVTLRIALDKGNVMLGIVGDTSQMEPTTISSSLSTVQELIDLCNRLQAGILCTEAIISERQDYGNRYLGKCIVGKQAVRVYEVFDGDEYNIRRGKADSMEDFSQGVYALYGGDASEAKHTFLKLAHKYPQDGGARYYLFLADRLEHDPTLPCVLNVDETDGRQM